MGSDLEGGGPESNRFSIILGGSLVERVVALQGEQSVASDPKAEIEGEEGWEWE